MMMRLPRLTLAGMIVAAIAATAVAGCSATSDPVGSSQPDNPDSGVARTADCEPRPGAADLGVFRGSGDPAPVDEFEQWLGCDVEYVIEFTHRATWEEIATPGYMTQQWDGDPRRLVVALAMLPDEEDGTMAAGARGEYDEYFESFGRELVEGGRGDSLIRPGWEFNADWSPYYTEDPQEFQEFWRRIVAALRSVDGQDFEFMWNPTVGGDDALPYYPGDDWVDIVGIDVYDATGSVGTYPYPANCDEDCRQERRTRAWESHLYGSDSGLRHYATFARFRDKPVMLPEWGLWNRLDGTAGGDNPYFIRQMYDFIMDPDNNVTMHAYFEYNDEDGEHRLMTDFPESAAVFRELFAGKSAT